MLKVVASGDLHWEALLKANFEAAPQSIPIIALSFVYQVTHFFKSTHIFTLGLCV